MKLLGEGTEDKVYLGNDNTAIKYIKVKHNINIFM